jgi:hypothetical protein
MILIVSFPNNEHVEEVRRHLTAKSVLVDTASFPVSLGLSTTLSKGRENMRFLLPG